MEMHVIKRNGKRESVKFDKITSRIEKLCYNLSSFHVSPTDVAQKVIAGLYDNVTTEEIDNLAAETAASMATIHPDYNILAGRLAISNLHKKTSKSFSSTMKPRPSVLATSSFRSGLKTVMSTMSCSLERSN